MVERLGSAGWLRPYLSGVLSALLVAGTVLLVGRPPSAVTEIVIATPTEGSLTVAISGEVTRPGVYTVPLGSRVADLIERAGGVTARADPAVPSRAQRLRDELHIHIPTQVGPVQAGEAGEAGETSTVGAAGASPASVRSGPGTVAGPAASAAPTPVTAESEAASTVAPPPTPSPAGAGASAASATAVATSLATPPGPAVGGGGARPTSGTGVAVPPVAASPTPPPRPAPTTPAGRAPPATAPPAGLGLVNLNTASTVELERLPGVGPALAARIIDARQRGGPFRRVDDLERVPGIGPLTLARLRPLVTV